MKNALAICFTTVLFLAVGNLLGFSCQKACSMDETYFGITGDNQHRSRQGGVSKSWEQKLPSQGEGENFSLPREKDTEKQESLRRSYRGRLIYSIYEFLTYGPQSSPEDTGGQETETEVDFTPEVIKESGDEKMNYAVMISASWCGPCKRMYPLIEELREEGYIIYVFDVTKEEFKDFAALYDAIAYPTFIIYNEGKEVDRIVGKTKKEWLTERLKTRDEQETKPDNPYDGLK